MIKKQTFLKCVACWSRNTGCIKASCIKVLKSAPENLWGVEKKGKLKNIRYDETHFLKLFDAIPNFNVA